MHTFTCPELQGMGGYAEAHLGKLLRGHGGQVLYPLLEHKQTTCMGKARSHLLSSVPRHPGSFPARLTHCIIYIKG